MRVKRRLRAFKRGEDGSTLMESALSLSVLLCLMLSIIGISQAAYAHHFVTFAARQGARYAMVRGSTFAGTACGSTDAFACQASATNVQNYVLGHLPLGISSSAVTVQTTWPGLAASGLSCLTLSGTNSPGCDVQVTVNYVFKYRLPYLPSGALHLASTSTLMIAQ